MSALRTRYHILAEASRQEKACSYPTLFWLFMAGSLMGTAAEGIWHYLHKGIWGLRVGTLWGPFCVLYGFGVVVMYMAALRLQHQRPAMQFLLFALTGSAVEYIASLFQEQCFGTMSWNYSAHALNINGRISLKMTLLWGVAGMALMYLLLPLLLSAFNRLHLSRRRILCCTLSLFMAVNLLMTAAALLRWQTRVRSGAPAGNAVEAYLDQTWPDRRMRERFPNMDFTAVQPDAPV